MMISCKPGMFGWVVQQCGVCNRMPAGPENEVGVACIEVAMTAVDRHAAAPELTPVERVVVIVETHEHDATPAVFEQAVVELGFGQRIPIAWFGQYGGVGEVSERQVNVTHLRFESLVRVVVKPDRSFTATVELNAGI